MVSGFGLGLKGVVLILRGRGSSEMQATHGMGHEARPDGASEHEHRLARLELEAAKIRPLSALGREHELMPARWHEQPRRLP